jgi:acyl-CoA thioester hydrolase
MMPPQIPAPLAEAPFVYWVQVTFRDLDALAHVNNAVYATYFESARIAYYQDLTGMSLEQLNIILAEMTISYKAPAFFGEWLAIGVKVESIGGKSFVMSYTTVRAGDEAMIATGRSVLVFYDYATGRTVPATESFRGVVAERQATGAEP